MTIESAPEPTTSAAPDLAAATLRQLGFNRAAARIEELVGAHRMLLANASHELRTPLSRIRLGVELWAETKDEKYKAAIARELISNGRTEKPVTGFKGRSGRSFRARLALMQTEEGRWRVEFDEPWAREGAKPPDEPAPAEAAAPESESAAASEAA